MPQVNHDLVCTRLKRTSKQKLEIIKAAHAAQHPVLAKSDYAMLERLIDYAYEHALDDITKLASPVKLMSVDEYA